ncbi:LLM class flavin-dependent oxidoreductase [Novosphingobium beihaiensis]|uniref:LLM class flavin-dependent oxidoreductase n=1 Tax=Novosphingobium beihaiensis TaxID=2930389 RepID=A0ABT0BUY5_9SPHN|nr:LLM class flavin-dependent oxidoreductase [Novosphingobium beihaiensis]MCJ2188474.1 LLM class flavin-dependent oxidoreductase [Novosphingobium beihaiensis]
MKFGIFLLMQSPSAQPSSEIYARALEIVETAEELGFEAVWLAEHHFTNYSHSSQPFVLLSHLAAHTRRIRLGTAIIPLPLHDPLLVAEQAATVDVLSHGRLELGLGKGYQQYQFDRLAARKEDDPEAFDEMVDLTVRALCREPFHFDGKTRQVAETLLYPHPVQQPPPIWYVVNSTNGNAVAAAARRGFNLFTGVLEPISKLTNVRAQVEALGLGHHVRIGTQRPVFVTHSESEAVEAVEEVQWNGRVSVAMRHDIGQIVHGVALPQPFPNEPSLETILADKVVIGTPDHCIHQIRRIQDGLGADTFNCSFWFGDLPQERILASMRLFAEQVMPAFASPVRAS